MVPSLLSAPFRQTGCLRGLTCYSFILVRYAPGTGPRAADARMQAGFSKAGCPPGAGCFTPVADQRPSDIRYYAGVRETPLLLGAVLALLAIGTLTHVLLASARRRRRDLALLKTLGLTRRQLLGVVAWQASALAAAALIVGVPLGVIAGRWSWRLFAGVVGVSGDAPCHCCWSCSRCR
jgi:putative ABC transport system permease protein